MEYGSLIIVISFLQERCEICTSFAISTSKFDVLALVVIGKEYMTDVPNNISQNMRMTISEDGDYIFYDENIIKFQDFKNAYFFSKNYHLEKFLFSDKVKFKFGFTLNLESINGIDRPFKIGKLGDSKIVWKESQIEDIFNNSYVNLQLLDISNIKTLKSEIHGNKWFDLDEKHIDYLKRAGFYKVPMNLEPLRYTNMTFTGTYVSGEKIQIDMKANFDQKSYIEKRNEITEIRRT